MKRSFRNSQAPIKQNRKCKQEHEHPSIIISTLVTRRTSLAMSVAGIYEYSLLSEISNQHCSGLLVTHPGLPRLKHRMIRFRQGHLNFNNSASNGIPSTPYAVLK